MRGYTGSTECLRYLIYTKGLSVLTDKILEVTLL